MPFGIEKVNILLHGLFFMRKNGDNLEIFAPDIPNHHFIGGVRGTRRELTGRQDLTPLGLIGKIGSGLGAPQPEDIDGGIMQFLLSDVQDFTHDVSKFRGSILLPWPIKFVSLRKGDITNQFRYVPTSNIGKGIEITARRKGSDSLGVVTLLQYKLPVISTRNEASQLNIHFYLQPSAAHKVSDVNKDLAAAANCFLDPSAFDLRLIEDGKNSIPTQARGHAGYGTTVEDERSIDEEFNQCPDITAICATDPPIPIPPTIGNEQPNVNPANCPHFFVG